MHLRARALAPDMAGHRERSRLLSLHLLPRDLLSHLPQQEMFLKSLQWFLTQALEQEI